MDQFEVEQFVRNLENVQQEDNFGYKFFFVGNDHRLAFVTIGYSDNEFDEVSKLDREGVFRVNIGVSRETFDSLLTDGSSENVDYSALNVFMPHPHYAKQNYLCILNPSEENEENTKNLILEAHSIATDRYERKRS